MSKPDWCTQEAKRVYHSLENSHVFNEIAIARALLEAHQRGRREGMEEAAEVADDWLKNEAYDLSDIRDGYIEARNSGYHAGRKISDEQARSFASKFGHRSDAVYICADHVSEAIRAKAREVKL